MYLLCKFKLYIIEQNFIFKENDSEQKYFYILIDIIGYSDFFLITINFNKIKTR